MSHVQMSPNQRHISVRYNLLALSMAKKRRDIPHVQDRITSKLASFSVLSLLWSEAQ